MTIRARLSRRSGGAILHFDHPTIPDVIRFDDGDWRAKREFHVTLLGSTTTQLLTERIDTGPDDTIRRAAKNLHFAITLRDDLWQLREDRLRTIVRMCDVSGAEELFERIETMLGGEIERPPFHVTLYTIGTLRGIGIATRTDLAQMGVEITGADRRALLSVLQ